MKISIILLAHNEEKNISYEIDLVKKNNRGKLRRILLQVFYRYNSNDFIVPGNRQMANGFFTQQFSGRIKGLAGINRYQWLRHYLSNLG